MPSDLFEQFAPLARFHAEVQGVTVLERESELDDARDVATRVHGVSFVLDELRLLLAKDVSLHHHLQGVDRAVRAEARAQHLGEGTVAEVAEDVEVGHGEVQLRRGAGVRVGRRVGAAVDRGAR